MTHTCDSCFERLIDKTNQFTYIKKSDPQFYMFLLLFSSIGGDFDNCFNRAKLSRYLHQKKCLTKYNKVSVNKSFMLTDTISIQILFTIRSLLLYTPYIDITYIYFLLEKKTVNVQYKNPSMSVILQDTGVQDRIASISSFILISVN